MARRSFRYYVKTGNGAVKIRKPGASVLREFREQALEMTMFNVGEGEAILLRVGNDVVLVDGGAVVKKGNVALGQALRGYLTDRGLKLMAILASHGHVDHLNAPESFLANDASEVLAPEAVYYHNGETLGPWLTDTLQARLNALGPEVITQVPVEGFGQFPGPGGTTITMFTDGRWKPRPAYKSIVASLPYRDTRILLTGDIYFIMKMRWLTIRRPPLTSSQTFSRSPVMEANTERAPTSSSRRRRSFPSRLPPRMQAIG